MTILLALTLHEFNQLYRFLLHFDEKAVNQRTEVAIENHGRDGDDQAETSVVQRDGNAVGQSVIDVMQAAQQAGLSHISFATQQAQR